MTDFYVVSYTDTSTMDFSYSLDNIKLMTDYSYIPSVSWTDTTMAFTTRVPDTYDIWYTVK